MDTGASQHWETVFSDPDSGYGRVDAMDESDPVMPGVRAALEHFGDLRGRTLLDVGCGNGRTSLFFAGLGANVIAVDLSHAAIANLQAYCDRKGIRNVTALQMPAQEIARVGQVDFAFGTMILHHIEPFREFAATLRKVVRDGGKGFFFENNARSALMIWFRENLVGRYGIPKFGDAEEFPLTPGEVEMLRAHFRVEQRYPEMYMLRMVPRYLLRGRLEAPFVALDRFLYRFPTARGYSYRQFLYLS